MNSELQKNVNQLLDNKLLNKRASILFKLASYDMVTDDKVKGHENDLYDALVENSRAMVKLVDMDNYYSSDVISLIKAVNDSISTLPASALFRECSLSSLAKLNGLYLGNLVTGV